MGQLAAIYDGYLVAVIWISKEIAMPLTLSYDLRTEDPNHRNYLRSMLERFGWTRLGGSVFRYSGRNLGTGMEEDWLNDVVPALMFFRSYVLHHNIVVRFLTLDANSVSQVDHSDDTALFGKAPFSGANLEFREPTNNQSSVQRIRDFVDAAAAAT